MNNNSMKEFGRVIRLDLTLCDWLGAEIQEPTN